MTGIMGPRAFPCQGGVHLTLREVAPAMPLFGGSAPFRDRADAGERLAERLASYRDERPLVLGIPRGGLPVAARVADRLDAPLDVMLTKKIGAPGNPELAAAAVGESGELYRNRDVIDALDIDEDYLEHQRQATLENLRARRDRYRRVRARESPDGRTVLLVDDGVATGATMRACVEGLRREGAARVVIAVPVAPAQTLEDLRATADEVVCLQPVEGFFGGIGGYYRRFEQTSDEEVLRLLSPSGG